MKGPACRGRAFAFVAASLLAAPPAWAGSLQVSPVSIELVAPGAAATLQLRNVGSTPLNAQIRVFRWVQTNGEEKLEPTRDVVASPPITTLNPGTDYTVRVVRVAKQPVARSENYRLLVDEIPDPAAQRNRSVNLVLRYSIPVFFYSREAGDARLTWSVERRNGRIYVAAMNSGDRHVRISALRLRSRNGATVSFGRGLTGYVFGRSLMRWAAPGKSHRFFAVNSVAISGQSDRGPIHAIASAQALH